MQSGTHKKNPIQLPSIHMNHEFIKSLRICVIFNEW